MTPDEAAGTSQEVVTVVAPTTPGITPEDLTLQRIDRDRPPSQKIIEPTVHVVDGLDGVPWTDPGPTTAVGEVIPGILRFPLPAPSQRAVGITEVLIANTIFGSLIGDSGPEEVFEMVSGAIIAPPPDLGRMTGGGSILSAGNVTHGFTLQCNVSQEPNRLEVNWGEGNKFHLEVFSSVACEDDPGIDEARPVAGFDTFSGSGLGRYNGVSGASIEFKFTDAGEPGKNDLAEIVITDAGGGVLNVSGNLKNGNHQAHPTDGNGAPLNASTLGETLWVTSDGGYSAVVELSDSTDPLTEMCVYY